MKHLSVCSRAELQAIADSEHRQRVVRTHYDGCWRTHLECAVHRVEVLRGVLQELEESADYWCEYDVPIGIVDRIKAVLALCTEPTKGV